MKLLAYLFCLALAGWGMAFAADASMALNLTPAQASYILQNSDNLELIFTALKAASVTPALQQEAINYLDHPTDRAKFIAYWQAGLPAGTDLNEKKARAVLKENWDANISSFIEFLAAHPNPTTFEIYKHLNQSIFVYELEGIGLYSKPIRNDPVVGPLFLDYLEDIMFNYYTVSYDNARGEQAMGGLLNARTGEFISHVQDSYGQAFMAATPIRETRSKYTGIGLWYFVGLQTQAGYERVAEILASDEYWANPDVGKLDFSNAGDTRYHLPEIMLYRIALAEPRVKDKDSVVIGLLISRSIPGDDMMKSAEPLSAANPKVYPDLLAFIRDAEKLNLSDEARKILADAKGELGQLMAKRNIDPASLVLPEPLQPRQHKPLPMAKNATVPVTTTTLSAAAAASKPELPYNPYHYESGLYPPFPWQAKILIVITILFTGWWFWTEWRTWPK